MEGSHRILLLFGKALWQPRGAAWTQDVGPVQDTLLITPVSPKPGNPCLKGEVEGGGWWNSRREWRNQSEAKSGSGLGQSENANAQGPHTCTAGTWEARVNCRPQASLNARLLLGPRRQLSVEMWAQAGQIL